MHEPVRQIARGGKQKQTFGVEVEATHGQPFPGLHGRQPVEHRWPAIRIVGADDFAGRLVVDQHARRPLADLALNEFAIDADLIGRQDTLSDVRRLAVDRNPSRDDQLFHVATRTEAGFGQHLVQLRCIVLGRQVAARALCGRLACIASDVRVVRRTVECIGSDEGKNRIGVPARRTRRTRAVGTATALLGAALLCAARFSGRVLVRPGTTFPRIPAVALGPALCALGRRCAVASLGPRRAAITRRLYRVDVSGDFALAINALLRDSARVPGCSGGGVAARRATGAPERARTAHATLGRFCIRAVGRRRSTGVAAGGGSRIALLAGLYRFGARIIRQRGIRCR